MIGISSKWLFGLLTYYAKHKEIKMKRVFSDRKISMRFGITLSECVLLLISVAATYEIVGRMNILAEN